MSSIIHGSSGLLQLNHADIKRKIAHQKLFGLDELQNYLFRFCKAILTADASMLDYFSLYDLAPSVLLYGPPNTGKTSLCYFLVLPVAQQKNVGVIAMKVPAYGRLFKPGGLEGMQQALGYSLSQPGVHCCIVAAETTSQLEHNVKIARAFAPLTHQELAAIEHRTAGIWEDSTFFRAWS